MNPLLLIAAAVGVLALLSRRAAAEDPTKVTAANGPAPTTPSVIAKPPASALVTGGRRTTFTSPPVNGTSASDDTPIDPEKPIHEQIVEGAMDLYEKNKSWLDPLVNAAITEAANGNKDSGYSGGKDYAGSSSGGGETNGQSGTKR